MGDEIRPTILAPAGDKTCFLSALAAGADAIYLGLKDFSARMLAENFELDELPDLVALAHEKNCRVMIALNIMLKQSELEAAFNLTRRLAMFADGLIVQDLGMLSIAAQAGFRGELTLSTLANVSNPIGLETARNMGATRVVLPRELNVDEMREMGRDCPQGLELECFVHGALCYCVSGRCYWSSYLGGKSGLRGRCVQPCRRVYARKDQGSRERYFACQDLELGALVKLLLSIPNLNCWKIEGRKKGPHYVYYTVSAYRLLRDNPGDTQARKTAEGLLEFALGRPGVKGRFLPQGNIIPMAPEGQTSSGLLAGKTSSQADGACVLKPRFDLLPHDYLRIGVEDERWHAKIPVTRFVPKGGTLRLNVQKHKTPRAGASVYLIDRREPELLKLVENLNSDLARIHCPPATPPPGRLKLPKKARPQKLPDMTVGARKPGTAFCLWLSRATFKNGKSVCWWLPPVIWPDDEAEFRDLISRLWKGGSRSFVLNAPWQRAFFPRVLPNGSRLIAGPFCNLANALALEELARAGFTSAFASPELAQADLLALPRVSPLPLGLVIGGFWPVGISRFGLAGLKNNEPFQSPKGEVFWTRNYGGNTWVYPAWPIFLGDKIKILREAGYSFFATLEEVPPKLPERSRPGLFNWAGALQ